MKKVLLPLLLLVAVSCLIAVESAPSAIVGYVKYENSTGYNMVALPMQQGYTTSSEIGIACGGLATSVIGWNGETQSWVPCDYYSEEDVWDPEFPVAAGMGLWVVASAGFNFYSMGTLPTTPTFDLFTGYNMVMIPLDRSDLSGSDLVGATCPSATSIIGWNGTTQSWVPCDYYSEEDVWDPVFPTNIGMPLFIVSASDATWPGGAKSVNSLKASRASK